MRRSYVLAVALAGCGFSVPSGTPPGDGPHGDAPRDAADAPADIAPLGPWGNITLISELSSTSAEDDPTLTADMLEIYFDRSGDIYGSTRAAITDPWSTPQPVVAINTTSTETTCEVSPDGLELFFSSNRIGGAGLNDIYVATRPNRVQAFGNPVRVTELATTGDDVTPTTVGASALVMYLTSTHDNGSLDLYRSTRATRMSAWATPVLITELQTTNSETEPTLYAGETAMIFSGTGAGRDLFVTTRPTTSAPWGPPAPITELNTGLSEEDPWVSPDGRTLFFASTRSGVYEFYRATR